MDGRKVRFEGESALALLDGVTKLVSIKFRKMQVFDLKKARPSDEELLEQLLGPTGNLRAPTMRVGSTLVVGFSVEAYEPVMGK